MHENKPVLKFIYSDRVDDLSKRKIEWKIQRETFSFLSPCLQHVRFAAANKRTLHSDMRSMKAFSVDSLFDIHFRASPRRCRERDKTRIFDEFKLESIKHVSSFLEKKKIIPFLHLHHFTAIEKGLLRTAVKLSKEFETFAENPQWHWRRATLGLIS